MRTCRYAACLTLVLACLGCAQGAGEARKATGVEQSSSPSVQPDVNDALESRVKAAWAAFKNKDKNAYADFLADEFVAVEADNEGERNKWHVLREVEHSMVYDYKLSFLKITMLCPDTAFVRYEAFLTFPPKSTVRFEKILIGEIWVNSAGQWKALHYQETHVK